MTHKEKEFKELGDLVLFLLESNKSGQVVKTENFTGMIISHEVKNKKDISKGESGNVGVQPETVC